METKEYNLNDKVIMKKGHPCGTNEWEIVRLGAEIVMIPRIEFNRKLKKVIRSEEM